MSPTTRHAAAGIALALLLGAALRLVWLTADPPAHGAVGIVWHDEGAWVYLWQLDELFGMSKKVKNFRMRPDHLMIARDAYVEA